MHQSLLIYWHEGETAFPEQEEKMSLAWWPKSLNPALRGAETGRSLSEVYRASSKRPELHIVRHTVSLTKSKIGRKRRRRSV